ncbi:MAG: hypothetical protein ACTSX9_04880 [Candidatus Njordarchaeales archaeon]
MFTGSIEIQLEEFSATNDQITLISSDRNNYIISRSSISYARNGPSIFPRNIKLILGILLIVTGCAFISSSFILSYIGAYFEILLGALLILIRPTLPEKIPPPYKVFGIFLLLIGVIPNIWLGGFISFAMLSILTGIALLLIRVEHACEIGLTNGKTFIIRGREDLLNTLYQTLTQTPTQQTATRRENTPK